VIGLLAGGGGGGGGWIVSFVPAGVLLAEGAIAGATGVGELAVLVLVTSTVPHGARTLPLCTVTGTE
jgi:hypothetical protein